ncbi:phosphopantetheine-binding protein [Streptomyces sp. JHA26]|uniref:phosphopantetheine-binding protein n=1 Tax=Streptomyces sp. JHA26 TaxID=1917143 RepID=UPI00098ACC4D|nr:phosphopantetheine-binding protein [Streptomyces sp. JHA26]
MSDTTAVGHDEILRTIRRHTVAVVPEADPARIRPERTLDELGCNSIDRAEILTGVLEELDIDLPLEKLTSGATVEELARLMDEHR